MFTWSHFSRVITHGQCACGPRAEFFITTWIRDGSNQIVSRLFISVRSGDWSSYLVCNKEKITESESCHVFSFVRWQKKIRPPLVKMITGLNQPATLHNIVYASSMGYCYSHKVVLNWPNSKLCFSRQWWICSLIHTHNKTHTFDPYPGIRLKATHAVMYRLFLPVCPWAYVTNFHKFSSKQVSILLKTITVIKLQWALKRVREKFTYPKF